MNQAARYVKIVQWSDEDRCFVGSCPGLFMGAVTATTNNWYLPSYASLLKKR